MSATQTLWSRASLPSAADAGSSAAPEPEHNSPTPRTLVTLATYNERENLPPLVREILATDAAVDVLVIDDNSPDGTGRLADEMAAEDARVRVLHRSGKLGLGSATMAGLRYALDHSYDLVLNMDADFSHHPRHIPAILREAGRADVVIGSRYVRGGGVVGWGWLRHVMSSGINLYSRLLLRLPVRDTSGAFRCYRTAKIREIDLTQMLSRGYSFQEEFLYRCRQAGARMRETPIVFQDRESGSSKINAGEALAALVIILRLGWQNIFAPGRPHAGSPETDPRRAGRLTGNPC